MGHFGGIKEASVSRSNNYFVPGVYPAVELNRVFVKSTRNNDTVFIVEGKVVASEVSEIPPGSERSWVVNLRHDAAMGNIKQFAMALLDVDEEDVDEDTIEALCDEEDNPASGKLIHLNATEITTKAGNPFTKHSWTHIPEERYSEFR